jgi:D-glycero-beta-D-manno-heptose-7-phosphate kinase
MDFNTLFQEFNNKNVLIVGDAMIDAYMWGKVNRMSPEAPVPVVEVKKHENRLGGAANVALNLKALGANPVLCSVVGAGNRGVLFKKLMLESKLSIAGILSSNKRKTTLKTRVISENKHQLRIDEEETSPILQVEEFLKLTRSLMSDIDVIILQDYNKGVLTPKVITELIATANKKEIPTIVDPKKLNFNSYKDCTIFKPNLAEIKAGMNINFNVNNVSEIEKASTELRTLLNARGVLLTLSAKGICINSEDGFQYTPAFKRNIIDVSGAGDTVIAVASLCLASRVEYTNLSILSTLAGGIVCEEVGVAPINKEKLLSEAIKLIQQ